MCGVSRVCVCVCIKKRVGKRRGREETKNFGAAHAIMCVVSSVIAKSLRIFLRYITDPATHAHAVAAQTHTTSSIMLSLKDLCAQTLCVPAAHWRYRYFPRQNVKLPHRVRAFLFYRFPPSSRRARTRVPNTDPGQKSVRTECNHVDVENKPPNAYRNCKL